MFEAWLGGDPPHVLILTPLSAFLSVQFVTTTPLTSFSSGYLPRLPTLLYIYIYIYMDGYVSDKQGKVLRNICSKIASSKYIHKINKERTCFLKLSTETYLKPCPGPQVTFLMLTSVLPWIIATQSSPVLITLLDTFTTLDWLIWIPSVLGLVAGAVIWRFFALMFWDRTMDMWKPMGLTEVICLIIPLTTWLNFIDCATNN